MIDQVTQAQVYQYVRELVGELPVWVDGEMYTITTRYTYSGIPIQKTTGYVGQRMQNLGLHVEYQTWGDTTYPNVIGEIPGLTNPHDIFIIGAHIDDAKNTPGADDNASGSVATMLAANILSQYQWGCTLRFAFWTGEEQGMEGSEAYALQAVNDNENIIAYLNLDKIAWNTIGSNPDISLFYEPSIPSSLPLAQLFAEVVSAYNLDLIPTIATGNYASDHSSFWQYGFNSIMAIQDKLTGDTNPYSHTPGDTVTHTDPIYFTNFVKASIATFAHMSNCLVSNEPVTQAEFTWQPLNPVNRELITFTGTSDGSGPKTYTWDFGDGTGGTGISPTHSYMSSGDYTVVFTTTNAFGSASAEHLISVTQTNIPPVVNAGPDQIVSMDNSVTLNGSASDDGLPNPPGMVTTLWNMVSGPGNVSFSSPSSPITTASFSSSGTYILRLTASDSKLITYDEVSIVVTGGSSPTITEVRVSSSSNDAEESATGVVNLVSSDLELVLDANLQTVGMRFIGITIPKNAYINTAYIQFQVDETGSSATSLTIRGEAQDNPGTFSTTNKNISSRLKTAASVSWSPPYWTVVDQAGVDQRTPDISTIIQELVIVWAGLSVIQWSSLLEELANERLRHTRVFTLLHPCYLLNIPFLPKYTHTYLHAYTNQHTSIDHSRTQTATFTSSPTSTITPPPARHPPSPQYQPPLTRLHRVRRLV